MDVEITECKNPNCQNPIEPLVPKDGKKVWRRTLRKFCSDQCQRDNWILNRATKLQKARNGQGDNRQPREHKLRDRMVNAGGSPKRAPGTGNMLDLILRSR